MGSLLILLLLCTNYNISSYGSYEKICIIRVHEYFEHDIYPKTSYNIFNQKQVQWHFFFFFLQCTALFFRNVFLYFENMTLNHISSYESQ